MFIIVSFVVMLVTLSASVDKSRYAVIGRQAPTVVVERGDTAASLQSMRGKQVVLSFWSAADAESRVMQTKLAALVRRAGAGAGNVEVMSVNFDRSEGLMNEIVNLDNLDTSSQYYVGSTDQAQAMRQAYEMQQGLRTFIIDAEGRIAVADPTDSQLARLMDAA